MAEVRVAKSAGFCYGVERAVKLAEETAREKGGCAMLGSIIHNVHVVAELEALGARQVDSVEEVRPGETVIIRSHGERKEVFDRLEQLGAVCVNATCPNVRRTRYDLKDAQARAHLLEGLLIAQDNIDEVIHIIRTSYDNAKENLMSRFGLDDVQAQAILDMRLKALQGLDREKLQAEYKELEEKIAYFLKVLSDDALVRSILKEELSAIAEKYGDDRKTEIQDVEDEIA